MRAHHAESFRRLAQERRKSLLRPELPSAHDKVTSGASQNSFSEHSGRDPDHLLFVSARRSSWIAVDKWISLLAIVQTIHIFRVVVKGANATFAGTFLFFSKWVQVPFSSTDFLYYTLHCRKSLLGSLLRGRQ
jgi:uncharacterized protein YecE (DUF72 family)